MELFQPGLSQSTHRVGGMGIFVWSSGPCCVLRALGYLWPEDGTQLPKKELLTHRETPKISASPSTKIQRPGKENFFFSPAFFHQDGTQPPKGDPKPQTDTKNQCQSPKPSSKTLKREFLLLSCTFPPGWDSAPQKGILTHRQTPKISALLHSEGNCGPRMGPSSPKRSSQPTGTHQKNQCQPLCQTPEAWKRELLLLSCTFPPGQI